MRGNSLAQFLGGTEAQASRPTRCAKKYKLNLKDEENFVIIDYLKMSERLSCEGRNRGKWGQRPIFRRKNRALSPFSSAAIRCEKTTR